MFFADGRTLDGDELIVVAGGANDGNGAVLAPGSPFGNDPATAAANIGDIISTLAAAGGEYFVVPNIGNLGETPFMQNTFPALAPALNAWIASFNALVEVELDGLESSLGVTIVFADQASVFHDILAEPRRFGFSNVTDTACPDCNLGMPAPGAEDTVVAQPHKYLFWDGGHLTTRGYKFLGKAMAADVKSELSPSNR